MSLSVFQVQGNVFVNLSAVTAEKAISLNLMGTDLVTIGFPSGVILYAAAPQGRKYTNAIASDTFEFSEINNPLHIDAGDFLLCGKDKGFSEKKRNR